MPLPADPLANRLRDESARRVLALAAGTVLAPLVAIVALQAVAGATAHHSPLPGALHQTAVGLPIVLVLYLVGHRFILRAPAAWFLAGRPGRRVLGWLAVGLAFPAAVLGVQLLVLDVTIARPAGAVRTTAGLVVASLAAGLLAGVLEELALRGALLRILEARWGPRVAVGATTVLFAVLHQGHARGPVTLALVLSSMLAAGLLLGVVVVRTRSVWNAVAVHAGWNTVFGGQLVAVGRPGAVPEPAVLRVWLHETSVWWTGGEATLGASPVTTGLLLAGALLVARSWSASSRPESLAATGTPGDR